MKDKTKIPLTSAEISGLWAQYVNDTLAVCVNRYFLEKVEDEEVRPVIEYTLDTAKENIAIMEAIFLKENFPIPIGFTEKDVNENAPKIFSDSFMVMYLRHMSNIAMATNVTALGLVTRPDLVTFHKRILNAAVSLQDKTRDLMLKQGTYVRPPVLSTPDKVDFVEKQRFLSGFFGRKRSLTSIEITHLFFNIQTNSVGKALVTAFAQTAQHKDVKQFFVRGKQIAKEHIDTFSEFLKKEDISVPISWESAITDATTSVFSDKMMIHHIAQMTATGIGYYGTAMAASPRRDVGLKYASLLPEASLYAEDGANIMIKHGWMEEPPQADNRDQLT